ncbi:MAG: phosphoribosylaminoimidazolesuccinocarboxamide synthase [Fimbriimonadaceae bacterium]|nr:phosphoribosylaminoimidazolesuccinocarboxamide synthase [Chthonomonadaceae bacterium]MCO5296070.1 phosphoribosylaminoimidazolesuccinocarboxamide synthase [Fimbriimonadaceae bacterium]
MPELLSTFVPGLGEPRRGKVREVYDLGDSLLIVATDRISAFDVVMANGIPDKGRILNQMSAFWFDRLGDVCPHHVLSTDDGVIARRIGYDDPELHGRTTLAKKARPLTIECVARGYLAGSLFKEYRAHGGRIHGLDLPPGVLESGALPEPIFTPATKAQEGHDENISFDEAVDRVGRETAETVRDWTLELFRRASAHAANQGLILADTKFEFGETDDGLLWIDEALTPDSSRFWDVSLYKPGGPQPSYDKQFVRDYLETLTWDKRPPGPTLPPEIVEKTRDKYREAYERITGQPFEVPAPSRG